jgi:AAA family ATP:ADP antiporter
MGAVLAGGGVVLATFRYMQRNIVPTMVKDANGTAEAAKIPRKKKPKMSMKESAKFLLSSPYIRNLAMLVISYGMCINIVEVSWKAKLKQAFPNPNEYSAFMGNFSSATGAVTLIMMLLGRTIFAKFGWRVAALITPINLGITGLLFFALNIFSDFFAPMTSALGTTPLMLAVLVGAAQNILSKSAKYSLFDPCKEMAYIPLDQESKTKGKAAIDVIGNPLGKSGGALIQQILIFGVGSLSAATPVRSLEASLCSRVIDSVLYSHIVFAAFAVPGSDSFRFGFFVDPGSEQSRWTVQQSHGSRRQQG